MNNWVVKKLEEIAEFTNGGAWSPKEYVDFGIPVVRVSDISNETISLEQCKYLSVNCPEKYKKHTLFAGDVVIATVGSHPTQPGSVVGRPAIVPYHVHGSLLNQNAVRIAPANRHIDKRYLGYLGKSQFFRDYIIKRARGSANQVRMSIELLKKMEVPLPPIHTQQKIASILSAYDDLIENNTRRIKILESMAQTIYQEWFVKFRFPGCEQVKMVESDLGLIPQGWEVKKLEDVCNLVMGQSPKSEFYNETGEGLPFHQGVSNFGARFPIDKIYCTVLNRIGKAGDILFSVRAPVGRINIANKKIIIGRGLCAIRSNTGNQSFIFQQLKEKFSEEDLMGGGTIFKSVTKKDMQDIKLIIPSTFILQKFESIVDPVFCNLELLISKNINLRKTRDLLLPKLISGQIDVENLDIDTGELAA